jgi:hypothetical protein
MGIERRTDRRTLCLDFITEYLYSFAGTRPQLVYLVDLSARGCCAFFIGGQRITTGDVFYMLRRGSKKVFYKACWCKEVGASAYRLGLKILDSGNPCERRSERRLSLQKTKFTNRRGEVEAGVVC